MIARWKRERGGVGHAYGTSSFTYFVHTRIHPRPPGNQSYEPLFFMINHSKKKTKTTNAISAHICSLPPVCIKLLS